MFKAALLTMTIVCLAAGGLAQADARADVLKLERAFNAAYAANDLNAYFAFYDDAAVLWFPEGRTDIPEYKKSWTAELGTGVAIEAGTMSDVHVKFSPRGDTAIASYLLHLKTRAADKSVSREVFQETDVWFKTEAGWKIAHVHYSPAPTPTPAH